MESARNWRYFLVKCADLVTGMRKRGKNRVGGPSDLVTWFGELVELVFFNIK